VNVTGVFVGAGILLTAAVFLAALHPMVRTMGAKE